MLSTDKEVNKDFNINNLFLNLDFQKQEETFEYKYPLLDHPSNYQVIVSKFLTRTSLPYIKLHDSKKTRSDNRFYFYDYSIKLVFDYIIDGEKKTKEINQFLCSPRFLERKEPIFFIGKKRLEDEKEIEYWKQYIDYGREYPLDNDIFFNYQFDSRTQRDVYSLTEIFRLINRTLEELFSRFFEDEDINNDKAFERFMVYFKEMETPMYFKIEEETPIMYITTFLIDELAFFKETVQDVSRNLKLYFSKNLWKFLKDFPLVQTNEYEGEYLMLNITNYDNFTFEDKPFYTLNNKELFGDNDDDDNDDNGDNGDNDDNDDNGDNDDNDDNGDDDNGDNDDNGDDDNGDNDDNDDNGDDDNEIYNCERVFFKGKKINIMEVSDYIGIAITTTNFPVKEQIYPHFSFNFETDLALENRRRYIPKSEGNITHLFPYRGDRTIPMFKKEPINDKIKNSPGEKILFLKYFDKNEDLNFINYENNNANTTLKMDLMNIMPLKKFTLKLFLIDRYNNFEPLIPKIEGYDDVIKLQLLFTRIKGAEKENYDIIETKIEEPIKVHLELEDDYMEEEGEEEEEEEEERNKTPPSENSPEITPETLIVPIPIPFKETEEDNIEAPPEKRIYLNTEEDENPENELY